MPPRLVNAEPWAVGSGPCSPPTLWAGLVSGQLSRFAYRHGFANVNGASSTTACRPQLDLYVALARTNYTRAGETASSTPYVAALSSADATETSVGWFGRHVPGARLVGLDILSQTRLEREMARLSTCWCSRARRRPSGVARLGVAPPARGAREHRALDTQRTDVLPAPSGLCGGAAVRYEVRRASCHVREDSTTGLAPRRPRSPCRRSSPSPRRWPYKCTTAQQLRAPESTCPDRRSWPFHIWTCDLTSFRGDGTLYL